MSYLRILGRMVNTPLAISQAKLEVLASNVLPLLAAGQPLPVGVAQPTSKSDVPNPKNTAIIRVFDTLVAKGGAGESGYTSYEGISQQIAAAESRGVSAIGFWFDSPGGEVAGMCACSADIYALRQKGIRTFAFSDGTMASAAYELAAACEVVYCTPSAIVGSIATLGVHVDLTEMDKKMGAEFTIFRSKPKKALGSAHEKLSQEARDRMTSMLATMDALFNNSVASHRQNLSVDAITALEGDVFVGADALAKGLVDHVQPNISSALNHFFSRGNKMDIDQLRAQLSATESKLTAAMSAHAELQAKLNATVSEGAAALSAAVTAERERCSAILKACDTLHLPVAKAQDHISRGMAADASLEIMTGIAEATSPAAKVNPAVGAGNAQDPDNGKENAQGGLLAAYAKATGFKLPTA